MLDTFKNYGITSLKLVASDFFVFVTNRILIDQTKFLV